MSVAEVQQTKVTDFSERQWLKEICLQLAYQNEKKKPGRKPKA